MKKQMKRTLSIFLTVLMLLGCWSFVAPQKAGAVKAGKEYSVTVKGRYEAEKNMDGYDLTPTFLVDRTLNGGAEPNTRTVRLDTVAIESENNTAFEWSTELTGFPKQIQFTGPMKNNSNTYGSKYLKFWVYSIVVNGIELRPYMSASGDASEAYNTTDNGNSCYYFKFQSEKAAFGSGTTTKTQTFDLSSKKPIPSQIELVTDPGVIQIPARSGLSASTTFQAALRDQYGVLIGDYSYANTGYNDSNISTQCFELDEHNNYIVYRGATVNGEPVSVERETTKGDGDVFRVTATHDARFTGGTEEKEIYVKLTYTWAGVPCPDYIPVTLRNPSYTYSYLDPEGLPNVLTPETETAVYGSRFTLPEGSRPGYELLGMFYKKSGTTYNTAGGFDYSATKPDVSSSSVVSGLESRWGTMLKPDASASTAGVNVVGNDMNAKYYAGWWAKDCTVIFRDNAGNPVGDPITCKYGQKVTDVVSASFLSNLLENTPYVKQPGEEGEFDYDHATSFRVSRSEAYVDSSDRQDPVASGEGNYGEDWDTAILTGDTEFTAQYTPIQASYSVRFLQEDGSNYIPEKNDYHFGDSVEMPSTDPTKAADNDCTYEFVGWAKQRSHEIFAVTDKDSTAVPILYDLRTRTDEHPELPYAPIVTQNLTLVPVFERTYKTYSAHFVVNVDGGGSEPIDQTDAYRWNARIFPPEGATASYIFEGYTYNFDGWYTTADYSGDPVNFRTGYVPMDNTAGRTFYAKYSQGDPTPNRIRFLLENDDGTETVLASDDVNYSTTDATSVQSLCNRAIAKLGDLKKYSYYEQDGDRYLFDKWIVKDGTVAADPLDDGENVNVNKYPVKPQDYYAHYDPKPLITVTLNTRDFAGTEKELWRYIGIPEDHLNLQGLSASITAPPHENDAYGSGYQFVGWGTKPGFLYDETDTEDVITQDLSTYVVGESNEDLYAKYTCTANTYTVTFKTENTEDAEIISKQENLHYGDEVYIPQTEDIPEAYRNKPSDDTFHYLLKGWNLDPSRVCVGNATYYLTYRRMYNYYTVNWLQLDNDHSTEEEPIYLDYKSENYIFNEVLRTPYEAPKKTAAAPEGMKWVLKDWIYSGGSKDGEAFVPGHRFSLDLMEDGCVTLYPTYELAEVTHKVTLYNNRASEGKPWGDIIAIREYPENTLYQEISTATEYTPPANEDGHYVFVRWMRIVSDDEPAEVLANDGMLTSDIRLVAEYELQDHVWGSEVIEDPTFAETGLRNDVCTICHYKSEAQAIPVLQDTTPPTGKIYVKDHVWESQTAFSMADPIPAGFDNMIVVNTADTANNAADLLANEGFNESGAGSGVQKIELHLARKSNNNAVDFSTLSNWHTAYVYHDGTRGNLAMTLQNLIDTEKFGSFENGDTVYIVAKITDGAQAAEDYVPQVTYINTQILILDDKAPTVYVTSSDKQDVIRHCEDVTLVCNDTDLASATLNGSDTIMIGEEQRTVLSLLAHYRQNADGTITPIDGTAITAPGQYQLVVTDKAGYSTSANFEIAGSHLPKEYRVEPTCTEAGQIASRCTRCGMLLGEPIVINPTGHTESANARRIEPTCEKDGEEYYYCIVCGMKTRSTVLNKFGEHNWQSIAEGYAVKEATCIADGLVLLHCKNCGAEKTETIPARDPEKTDSETGGHKYYGIDTVEATCTEAGSQTKECMYCHWVVPVATLEPLGHQASSTYETVIQPTCTEAGLEAPLCKRCSLRLWAEEGDANREMFETKFGSSWREVASLGHSWNDGERFDPTETEEGYTLYTCSRCGETEIRDRVPMLRTCYLTVMNEDGTTQIIKLERQQGSYISIDDIGGKPTKAQDIVYTYSFDKWTTVPPVLEDPEEPETPETPEDPEGSGSTGESGSSEEETNTVVTFPLQLNEDLTIYANFTKAKRNYEVKLYDETGEIRLASLTYHYGDVMEETQTREADVEYKYEFLGWVPLTAGDDAIPQKQITIEGEANYRCKFARTPQYYAVTWGYSVDDVLYSTIVGAHENAVYEGPEPIKYDPNATVHHLFSGWDVETNDITRNTLVTAKFEIQEAHDFIAEYTDATCTHAAGVKKTCSVCGKVIVEDSTQPALGHVKTEMERVNPVINPDGTVTNGYVKYKCSRCGEELPDEYQVLTEASLITIKVTVKNKKGELLEGAKVTVLDGSTVIDSQYSGVDGVAVLRVPQAKQYKIVLEYEGGSSTGTIEVKKNGKIEGTIPTVNPNTSTQPVEKCPKNCTCHKSGLWANLFRFIHKIIYALTKTKCCPDAKYL